MSNKILEKNVYPNRGDKNGEDVCELALKIEVDIAIDVTHDMEYFHHDSFVQVVHFYLILNSMLLDEDMIGNIMDFGIVKLIDTTPTNSL